MKEIDQAMEVLERVDWIDHSVDEEDKEKRWRLKVTSIKETCPDSLGYSPRICKGTITSPKKNRYKYIIEDSDNGVEIYDISKVRRTWDESKRRY